MLRRQKKFLIGAVLTALVASATPASAHVVTGVETLRDTKLFYRAPVEPAFTTEAELAAHHTQKLVVSFPAGFKVRKCYKTSDFTCKHTVDQVTFTRRSSSTDFGLLRINGVPVAAAGTGNLSAAEFFKVKVRTPGIRGTYPTPALQVYSDGEEVNWADVGDAAEEPGSHPAPTVDVQGPDRAPKVARGVFKPVSEVSAGNPCPASVIAEAATLIPPLDPAVHCGHFGFTFPPGADPPAPDPDELDIRGKAKVTRYRYHTRVELDVTGLVPGEVYPAHLHEGTCASFGPHYKNDPAGIGEPPNELWPSSTDDPLGGLIADSSGEADDTDTFSDWVARPTARSIWIHASGEPNPDDPHSGHVRIACADLV